MGEKVGWRRWNAILMGFLGVLIVIRPGFEGFRPEALWVLITVAGLTLRDLAAQKIPPDLSNAQVSAWGIASVALLGAMMLPFQTLVVPGTFQGVMLLGTLVFGTAGYWAITAATRVGEVSVVSPFRYSRLIFADEWTLIGAAMIIGFGLYAFARERTRHRSIAAEVDPAANPAIHG
jgi:drug/metabolite transporter (DMT)-like permease